MGELKWVYNLAVAAFPKLSFFNSSLITAAFKAWQNKCDHREESISNKISWTG